MNKRVKIGIDLGATRVKIGVVNQAGRILCRREVDTPFNVKPAELVSSLVVNIGDILRQAGLKKGQIAGVGIGVPGPVDSEKGIVRYFPNIKGWENVALKSILERRLRLKVSLDNDVNAMTMAEHRFGAGKAAKNLVCLTLGTGVGGGIIINGGIYRGSTMCAGEIGHVPINEKGPRCNCRGIACIERYIGNRYVLNGARKIFGKSITLERLDRLAKSGNRKAAGIWADVGTKLGVALAGVVNLLNPDMIIVGGGVSKAGELILRPLRKEIKRHAMIDQARHVKVVRAKLGTDAGIIGASLLA
ncbi:MAG: ROK family protein [Candidatus Omnitrophica bacterium]|nr:ROK family protein [Candidatus Omnitrophota bacterium]MBU4589325.1 ROK family protein [Candidatus Omnitrophota bacterium]